MESSFLLPFSIAYDEDEKMYTAMHGSMSKYLTNEISDNEKIEHILYLVNYPYDEVWFKPDFSYYYIGEDEIVINIK